jgi:hypothetical protein
MNTKCEQSNFWENAEIISVYKRAQAIEDGFLVDVSKDAREAGFKYPVAITRVAWGKYVEIPTGVTGQDIAGRLWDILWMLRHYIKISSVDDRIMFRLYVRNDNRKAKMVTLKALCGPGDDAEPVITIMLPEED